MSVRAFVPTDIDGVTQLYQVAFADEMRVLGRTPEDEAKRLRAMTWGRMWPFSLSMRLLGKAWHAVVAEQAGEVIGGCVHLGGQIFNFMVAPKHRGQGVGQAMLQAITVHAQTHSCAWATAEVLKTNPASLKAFQNQGFDVCGQAMELDMPTANLTPNSKTLSWRPAQRGDRPALETIETAAWGAVWMQAGSSSIPLLIQDLPQTFYNSLAGNQVGGFVFERAGQVVGFILANLPKGAQKGRVRLFCAQAEDEVIQGMLYQAGNWFAARGVSHMRAVFPNQIGAGIEIAKQPAGAWTWLCLAKSLVARQG